MKLFRRILIVIIVLVVLVVCVFFVVPNVLGKNNPVTEAIDDTKIAIANSAIDATGVKARAQEALEANTERIADATGLPLAVVTEAVDSLDIESWQVTTLPKGAVETGTMNVDYGGITADVTTYDDPTVVTVDAYGQSVTLAVPEDAQGYVRYLALVEDIDPNRVPAAGLLGQ